MRILQLTAENIKRVVAVDIKPDGSPVVHVKGKNGAGKSSTLDAIAYVLGGKDLICEEPLRRGSKKGFGEIKLGETIGLPDLIATRTFTAGGGGTLKVTNREGAILPGPQSVLDALTGKLSFDPLAFTRMPAKEQANTLRKLVGLDFSKIDSDRKAAFDHRTNVNRTLSQLQARLKAMPHHADAPDTEIAAADVMKELDAANAAANSIRLLREQAARANEHVDSCRKRSTLLNREIERLIGEQATVEREIEHAVEVATNLLVQSTSAKPPDTESPRRKLAELDQVNAKVRDNQKRAEVEAMLVEETGEELELSFTIQELDARKKDMLADAKFPVNGLSFDENGVRLNDLPLSQASAAEQLRASVAIGFAMNPKLRVVLIRDGSLLDSDSLEAVATMAAKHDAQVWIESVTNGEKVGIVIEDGCFIDSGAEKTGA